MIWLGGFTMLVYAHDYPAEVSGLVLVDAQALPSSDGATSKPAPKPGANSLPSLLARAGLVRLLAGPLGSIKNLPEEDKQAYKASTVTPRSVQTFLDEGRGMAEGGAQARAVTTLGALPLIVLCSKTLYKLRLHKQYRLLQCPPVYLAQLPPSSQPIPQRLQN